MDSCLPVQQIHLPQERGDTARVTDGHSGGAVSLPPLCAKSLGLILTQ